MMQFLSVLSYLVVFLNYTMYKSQEVPIGFYIILDLWFFAYMIFSLATFGISIHAFTAGQIIFGLFLELLKLIFVYMLLRYTLNIVFNDSTQQAQAANSLDNEPLPAYEPPKSVVFLPPPYESRVSISNETPDETTGEALDDPSPPSSLSPV
ncbi:uncharacterized protein BJ171DRAFT_62917 [Polychytrium aggregatum]|uniref:uncharacterized protein n=1 Tax=Polychytrium aggregatum TaxID=110093 RepID=UPI0022FDE1BC|nr:uncharacterized protein BJ171DRAFT_62917 [Polychytrium aggregatum]KAI9205567.1 hypothetical protein BJ171DRAFT_62917 [Polychytrium aggregatum]